MLQQFDGPNGEAFQQAAATFCKYQSVALESLRDRRKKDSKLQVPFLFTRQWAVRASPHLNDKD